MIHRLIVNIMIVYLLLPTYVVKQFHIFNYLAVNLI